MARGLHHAWLVAALAGAGCGGHTDVDAPADAAVDAPHVVPRIVITEIMAEPRRSELRERFDGANFGPYVEEADDDTLQYVELSNADAAAVELTGWSLGSGVTFAFPPGTRLEPGAHLVIAADPARLAALAGVSEALGPFDGRLRHGGEIVSVHDATGAAADRVSYGARPPWPMRPATGGASLERISLAIADTTADNWRASTAALPAPLVGAGTPGRASSVAAAIIPPFVAELAHAPEVPAPGQAVTITARVTASSPLTAVELLTGTGLDAAVTTAAMSDDGLHGDGAAADGLYGATVPGAAARALVHYRVRATAADGATTYPYDDDPSPTRAYYHRAPAGNRFHLFVRQADLDVLQAAARASPRRDVDADGTVVIDGVAYPHIDVSLGGRWPRANPPFAWRLRLNPDRPYRGVTALNLTWSRPDVQHAIFDAFAAVGLPRLASEVIDLDLTTGPTDATGWSRYLVFESPNKTWLEKHAYPDATALYKARSCESSGPRRNSDLYWFGDPGNERGDNGLQTDFNYWAAWGSVRPFSPPDDIRALVAAVNDLPDAELLAWLDANVDVDAWFRSIALHVYLRLSDFSTHNYFLLRPPAGKWTVLSYDFDQFGNFYVLPALYAARQDGRENPNWQRNRLHERIATSPTLKRVYLLSMRALLAAHTPTTLLPADLRPPIEQERASLLAELSAASLPPLSAAPAAAPCGGPLAPGLTVRLTVPAGWDAYYTLDGTDPRLSPTRVRYTAPVPVAAAATLRAASLDATQPPSSGRWTDRTECPFTAP